MYVSVSKHHALKVHMRHEAKAICIMSIGYMWGVNGQFHVPAALRSWMASGAHLTG
jgi:hypothetical protein